MKYPKYIQNEDQKKAFRIYKGQKKRCWGLEKKYKSYKGLTVDYKPKEFIKWWCINIKHYIYDNDPTCGRINHSKGYSFDNIRIESRFDNSMELVTRNQHFSPVKIYVQGKWAFTAKSMKEASDLTGIAYNSIPRYCNGELYTTRCGCSFKRLSAFHLRNLKLAEVILMI